MHFLLLSRHLGKQQVSLGWLQLMKSKSFPSSHQSSSALPVGAVHDQIFSLCSSGMATCQISLPAAVCMSSWWTFMRNMAHWCLSGLEGVLLSASAQLISWNNILTPTGCVSILWFVFESVCSFWSCWASYVKGSWGFVLSRKKMRLSLQLTWWWFRCVFGPAYWPRISVTKSCCCPVTIKKLVRLCLLSSPYRQMFMESIMLVSHLKQQGKDPVATWHTFLKQLMLLKLKYNLRGENLLKGTVLVCDSSLVWFGMEVFRVLFEEVI